MDGSFTQALSVTQTNLRRATRFSRCWDCTAASRSTLSGILQRQGGVSLNVAKTLASYWSSHAHASELNERSAAADPR